MLKKFNQQLQGTNGTQESELCTEMEGNLRRATSIYQIPSCGDSVLWIHWEKNTKNSPIYWTATLNNLAKPILIPQGSQIKNSSLYNSNSNNNSNNIISSNNNNSNKSHNQVCNKPLTQRISLENMDICYFSKTRHTKKLIFPQTQHKIDLQYHRIIKELSQTAISITIITLLL